MPKVSVIIPCYNQGIYIDETIDSVLNQTFQDFEIIIINDGSTDEYTNKILNDYNKSKTSVITTKNQGLSEARNTGIKISKGDYILPLDADDKIHKDYLKEGINILEQNPEIGIVYCDVQRFGADNDIWIMPDFSLKRILLENIMVCTSFFRKDDWEKTNGYNSNMVYGWEDWDFWLSILELNRDVYKIPKVMFFYRTKYKSMITNMDNKKRNDMYLQLYNNHLNLFNSNLPYLIEGISDLKNEVKDYRFSKSYRIGRSIFNFFNFTKIIKSKFDKFS